MQLSLGKPLSLSCEKSFQVTEQIFFISIRSHNSILRLRLAISRWKGSDFRWYFHMCPLPMNSEIESAKVLASCQLIKKWEEGEWLTLAAVTLGMRVTRRAAVRWKISAVPASDADGKAVQMLRTFLRLRWKYENMRERPERTLSVLPTTVHPFSLLTPNYA